MLDKISFDYFESEKQDNLFSEQHTKFTCIIKYNKKQYTFYYQCNIRYCEPTKEDCIACLLQDMQSISYNNLQSWLAEYGYDTKNMAQGVQAYRACKKTQAALLRIFNDDELEQLWQDCEQYM